jgi:hypothetical protein
MNEGMDRPSSPPSARFQVPPTVLAYRPRHLVRSVLAAWTGILIILVVSASRTIPPVILAFLLPYLALVAWHLLAPQRRVETGRYPNSEDSAPMPRPDSDSELATSALSASLEVGADSSDVSETSPAPGTEPQPSTTASVRSRRRIKPKALPEPAPALWVQVGPGRFVRGEEAQPSPDSLVEVEPIAHAPETPPDPTDDDPHDDPLPDDAATDGLDVGDPAGSTEVPVMAPGASEPGDGPVPLQEGEDHVLMVEAVPADSVRLPGSSCSGGSRAGVASATPGSHWTSFPSKVPT